MEVQPCRLFAVLLIYISFLFRDDGEFNLLGEIVWPIWKKTSPHHFRDFPLLLWLPQHVFPVLSMDPLPEVHGGIQHWVRAAICHSLCRIFTHQAEREMRCSPWLFLGSWRLSWGDPCNADYANTWLEVAPGTVCPPVPLLCPLLLLAPWECSLHGSQWEERAGLGHPGKSGQGKWEVHATWPTSSWWYVWDEQRKTGWLAV